jgi:hypothetical protein
MPKISKGGVSDRYVDPDYMAPSGTPVAVAMDLNLPDAGRGEEESSPGTTSPGSPPKRERTTRSTKSGGKTPSTAPTTTGHSSQARTGNSIASSADTSSAPGRKQASE